MKNFKRAVVSSMFAASLFAGSAALAGSATSNMGVSASVTNSCSISASPIAFGAYDPGSLTDTQGSTTMSVTCTLGSTASIRLGQGSHPAASSSAAAPARQMNNGTDNLAYSIFQDALLASIWGDTAGSGVSTLGLGLPVSVPVFATIPAGQNVSAGSYTDTVIATVSF